MMHKIKNLSFIFLLIFGLANLQAQTIYVVKADDSQTSYSLSNIQKLSFSDGNINVQKFDNFTDTYALAELRYLNFEDLISGFEDQSDSFSKMQLASYPNPVSDFLNIDLKGLETQGGIISILNLDGKVIQSQKIIESFVTLDLSGLAQGIYICRYTNENEIKTVKIIKE